MTVAERMQAIGARLRSEYKAERVILFGSYTRGNAGPDSDVDFLVVAPTDERFFQRMAAVLDMVQDMCPDLPLSPIVLTPAEVSERLARGDPFVEEILRTGLEV